MDGNQEDGRRSLAIAGQPGSAQVKQVETKSSTVEPGPGGPLVPDVRRGGANGVLYSFIPLRK